MTGTPQRLASVTDSVTRVSAASDGRIVISVSPSVPHIWGLPIDGKGHAAGPPKQLAYGPATEGGPALSRDGGKLAFVSTRGMT